MSDGVRCPACPVLSGAVSEMSGQARCMSVIWTFALQMVELLSALRQQSMVRAAHPGAKIHPQFAFSQKMFAFLLFQRLTTFF
tara:strand:+ start:245 stop:493 length:249 start_codon:yes stop_codon:yes gene_type:complete